MVSSPVFAGLALIAPELVPLLFGERWVDAVPAVQIMALAGLGRNITPVNLSVMKGMGRIGWRLIISIIQTGFLVLILSAIVQTGFLVLVLSIFEPGSITRVALAVLMMVIAMWPVKMYVFQKVTDISVWPQLRSVVPAFIATLVMAASVLTWAWAFAEFDNLALLASKIALGVVVYTATLWLIAPQDVDKLKTLLLRR